jgi:uncharacterized protein YbjQ (UPF0145 family)
MSDNPKDPKPIKDLTGIMEYADSMKKSGQAPSTSERPAMDDIPIETIDNFESLEEYAVSNPAPESKPDTPYDDSGSAFELPAGEAPASSSELTFEPSPEFQSDFAISETTPESTSKMIAPPDGLPAFDFAESDEVVSDGGISAAGGGHPDLPDPRPDDAISADNAGSADAFPTFDADPPVSSLAESPPADFTDSSPSDFAAVQPGLPPGMTSEMPAPSALTSGAGSNAPDSAGGNTSPSFGGGNNPLGSGSSGSGGSPSSRTTASQAPRSARSAPPSSGGAANPKLPVAAAYPFSLLITGALLPDEKSKLLDILARENMGVREIDLEPQLASGKILIPRISEYAGVIIVQALRGTRAKIRLGPSDQIFSTQNTRDEDTVATTQNIEDNFVAHSTDSTHPAEDMPVTSGENLPGDAVYTVIDTMTASASLKAKIVEAENSSEYQEIIEALQREIKYKAFRRGAQAVVQFKIQMNVLSSPTHYRILATGAAVKYGIHQINPTRPSLPSSDDLDPTRLLPSGSSLSDDDIPEIDDKDPFA